MNIICDSSFWAALYKKDSINHSTAIQYAEKIELTSANIIIPWPSMYIFLDTNFFKLGDTYAKDFSRRIENPKYIRVKDDKYDHFSALESTIESKFKPLIDYIVEKMIEDPILKIDYIISFRNIPKFREHLLYLSED